MVRFVFACVVISAGLSLVAAQGQKTTWDKVYTAEQASRGEKLYATTAPRATASRWAVSRWRRRSRVTCSISNWEGVTLNDLFERMRTSMPQNKPGSLSRAQNADILAHMLKVGNSRPATSRSMVRRARSPQIKFATYKP
jgi:hypothetical protein